MIKLKPHQENFVNEFFDSVHHGLVAVHPTGSGKTILSIAVAERYLSENPSNTVVVVVPKTLIFNYHKEIDKFGVNDFTKYRFFTTDGFYFGYKKNCMIVDDDVKDEDDEEDETDLFFEKMFDLEEEERKFIERMGRNLPVNPSSFNTTNSLLIVDEGHNLRTSIDLSKGKGKRPFVFIQAAGKADKVMILTATPLINYPSDIANLVSMVTQNNDGRYYSSKEFTSLLEDRELSKVALGGKFHFHTLSPEDLKEYPSVKYKNVYMKMPDALYNYYKAQEGYLGGEKDLENDFFKMNLSKFYTGIRQASNLTPEELEGLLVKSDWIRDYVESTLDHNRVPQRKFVIYSQYIKYGIELVQDQLDKLGVKYGMVIGTTTPNQRRESVMDYNGNKVKILLISKSGREGIDLEGTDDIIIMENGWNVPNENQIVGRGVRRGSHAKYPNKLVTVHRLLMVKPSEYEYGSDKIIEIKGNYNHLGELKSADLLLMSLSIWKKALIENTFDTIKAYNTAVKEDQDYLLTQGDNAARIMNKYLISEVKKKIIVVNRIPTEGIVDEIMMRCKGNAFVIRLPLTRLKSSQHSVKFNKGYESGLFFENEWQEGYLTIYLCVNMGMVNDVYFDNIQKKLKNVLLDNKPNQSNVLLPALLQDLERHYRKSGVYINITEKKKFIKQLAKLGIAIKNGKSLTIMETVRMFLTEANCFVNFYWWNAKIVTHNNMNVIVLSSNHEPEGLTEKMLYVIPDSSKEPYTLIPFTLNCNESVYDIFKYLEKSPGDIPMLYINNIPYFPNVSVSEVPYNGIFTIS